jgi:hypothetical protein
MYCPSCKAEVADDSAFCSECGVDVRPQSAREVAEREKQEDALLATANLWRMRGRWTEAERCCVDVMRANPNCVHAHSMLGDIYRDQGRYEDAAQWYRLALDLDPDSLADRAKLDRVKAELARTEKRLRRENADAPPPSGVSRAPDAASNRWLKALAGLAVVFVALVGVLLIAMTRPPTRGAARKTAPPAAPAPSAPAAPLNVPLPPPTADRHGAARPRDDEELATPQSDREAAIERAIGARANLACSVLDAAAVQTDGVSVLIVLTSTPPSVDTADAMREILLSEARRSAVAALTADPDLTQAVVRIRTNDRSGRLVTTFQGVVPRPTDAQADAADFSATWWAPELRP